MLIMHMKQILPKSSQHSTEVSYRIVWLETDEFIRLTCPNDKRYDYVVFAIQFRCQFPIFQFRALLWLSWYLHAYNTYERDTSKITAPFFRLSYCFAWFDTIEFNCLPCPNDIIYDDVDCADRFRYQLTMYDAYILIGLLRHLDTDIAYETIK